MADLIAYQDGNWNGSTTWKTVSTGANAKQATTTSSTNTTTSYLFNLVSSITIANGEVLEGLLMHCARVNTTGTVTVGISDNSGGAWVREVTVNASDLPTSASWVFFKFGTTLTGDGGTDYKVGVKASSTGNATFWRDSTTGNWARYIRTNTTATAAATDVTFICDELTGAGAKTDVTVTVSGDLSATSYGAANVGQGGILAFSTTASTTNYLKLAGDLTVWNGGTLRMGNSSTPVPRSSTASLNFACTSVVQYGLTVKSGGTFTANGESRTSGKDVTWCLLNANASANATSLTVDTDTGWLDNDEIGIASTSTTAGQNEKGALNGNATASTLTVDGFAGTGGGIQSSKLGTDITKAEIGLLTRNVRIFGASSSNTTYVTQERGAAIDMRWTAIYWLGSSTTDKRGLNIASTTADGGSFNADACSFYDGATGSRIYLGTASVPPTTATINNCVFYNLGGFIDGLTTVTGAGLTITNNVFIRNGSGVGITLYGNQGTYTGNRIASSASYGIEFAKSGQSDTTVNTATISNLVVHSCAFGVAYDWRRNGMSDVTIYHCLNTGFTCGTASDAYIINPVFTNLTVVGCPTNIDVPQPGFPTYNNLILGGTTSFSTSVNINLGAQANYMLVNGGKFSEVTGIRTKASSDITVSNACWGQVLLRNVLMDGTTEVTTRSNFRQPFGAVKSQRHDQVAGSARSVYFASVNTTDTTIFKTASPSERIAPTYAAYKAESGSKRFAVATGTTASVSVWVRESVVGDGTDYNGNRIRLMMRRNDAAGVSADTVLATATASSEGAWQQLTGTTPTITDNAVVEVYVDCDGTTGWINVDDWSVA